jgi:hypothetical protein
VVTYTVNNAPEAEEKLKNILSYLVQSHGESSLYWFTATAIEQADQIKWDNVNERSITVEEMELDDLLDGDMDWVANMDEAALSFGAKLTVDISLVRLSLLRKVSNNPFAGEMDSVRTFYAVNDLPVEKDGDTSANRDAGSVDTSVAGGPEGSLAGAVENHEEVPPACLRQGVPTNQNTDAPSRLPDPSSLPTLSTGTRSALPSGQTICNFLVNNNQCTDDDLSLNPTRKRTPATRKQKRQNNTSHATGDAASPCRTQQRRHTGTLNPPTPRGTKQQHSYISSTAGDSTALHGTDDPPPPTTTLAPMPGRQRGPRRSWSHALQQRLLDFPAALLVILDTAFWPENAYGDRVEPKPDGVFRLAYGNINGFPTVSYNNPKANLFKHWLCMIDADFFAGNKAQIN